MARSFSSWVSQRAVSGRSVRVKKAIMLMPIVMIPSTRKIIRHDLTEPILSSVRIPDARSPPNAPESMSAEAKEHQFKRSYLLAGP